MSVYVFICMKIEDLIKVGMNVTVPSSYGDKKPTIISEHFNKGPKNKV